MESRRSTLLISLLLALLLAGSIYSNLRFYSSLRSLEKSLEESNSRISALESYLDSLEKDLKEKEKLIADLEELAMRLEERVQNSSRRIEELEERIRAEERILEKISSEISILRFNRTVRYRAVAVSIEKRGEMRGSVINITLKLRRYPRGIYLNLENLLADESFEHSILIAKKVVENVTGEDLDDYGLFITLSSREYGKLRIVGESAGAAIALSMIAALENMSIRNDVMITGALLENGTIARVEAVREKALAARDAGARIFLVPRGEGIEVEGIEIVEVESIRDAMPYVLERR